MPKGYAEIAHGPMLIGYVFNLILYGIMITQVYLYHTAHRRDPLWMKIFVFAIFLADTANTTFDFVYLYNCLIKQFGNMDVLAKADWLFATDPAITGIIASMVQLFFAWRIWVLTKNVYLAIVVVLFAFAGGVAGIVTAYEVIKLPYFVEFQDFKRKHKTGFKDSDMMVDRIIRMTVQTGLLTSVVAIIDLVTFLTDSTGTHLIFNFPLCKLYTNSLMSNLNSRGDWKYENRLEKNVDEDPERSMGASRMQEKPDNYTSIQRRSQANPFNITTGNRSIKLSASEIFNVRSKPRHKTPEVFVHVESHELCEVSSSPSSHQNFEVPAAQDESVQIDSAVQTQVGSTADDRLSWKEALYSTNSESETLVYESTKVSH